MRRCIACGTSRPKQELIRIVTTETPADAGTGKMTEVDPTGRKNGRGAYLCKKLSCLEKAIKHKGLERSLKTPVPAEVFTTLKEEYEWPNE